MLRLASKRLLGLASCELPSRPLQILPRLCLENLVGHYNNGPALLGAPTRIFDSCFKCFSSESSLVASSVGQSWKKMSATPSNKVSEKRNIADHKRRLLAAKYELRRNLYKALCKDPELPSELRDKYRNKLSKLPRNSSFVRVRNRCIFSGRPRGVYRKFRMSRIMFRGLAAQGALMGVKKASW